MKYILAVSGGVDSVVLLDMMSKTRHNLIVAHVDHGIREDSAADARFVEQLARRYKLPFVMKRYDLGARASEDRARDARYDFLFEQAKKFDAEIVTAHHQGDAIETMAINFKRGTGWRGLAVLARKGIYRPLLPFTKNRLYEYALTHHLEWVEDSTNQSNVYQRNRVRRVLHAAFSLESATKLMELRARQLQLVRDIDRESARLAQRHGSSRHFLTNLDHDVAVELLGAIIKLQTGVRPVRPQLERALLAIKTVKPGGMHDVGDGVKMRLTSRNYELFVV